MLPWPSNSLWQWVQTRDVILIYAEALHDARVIRIDSRHAPAAVTSWLGDSIGWWEGDSLVVETKHFPPTDHGRLSPYHAYLLSHEATVTERFKRTSANELQYDFTVADPVYYTQPWKGEAHFTRTTDRSYEYACHEGNYTLLSVLQAARNREHALQETSGASSNPTTSVTSPPK